jgi:hypothetical protein
VPSAWLGLEQALASSSGLAVLQEWPGTVTLVWLAWEGGLGCGTTALAGRLTASQGWQLKGWRLNCSCQDVQATTWSPRESGES